MGQYFAPSFFSPFFFPPLAYASQEQGRYFAPAFFSPHYFPSLFVLGAGSGVFFPPTFFSPYYFAAFRRTSNESRCYFPPTFFSPYYFASLLRRDADDLDGANSRYRDRDGFSAAVLALRATGAFAEVAFGTSADRRVGGADVSPLAVITPEVWEESEDCDPSLVARKVGFSLTIIVRDNDPVSAYDRLDRLSCIVQNALNGNSLGGGSLPALTRVWKGSYDLAPVEPEKRVILRGGFEYLVDSPNSHAISN